VYHWQILAHAAARAVVMSRFVVAFAAMVNGAIFIASAEVQLFGAFFDGIAGGAGCADGEAYCNGLQQRFGHFHDAEI